MVVQFNKACKSFLDTRAVTSSGRTSKTLSAGLILNSIVDRCKDKTKKRFWPSKSLQRLVEECNVAAR